MGGVVGGRMVHRREFDMDIKRMTCDPLATVKVYVLGLTLVCYVVGSRLVHMQTLGLD